MTQRNNLVVMLAGLAYAGMGTGSIAKGPPTTAATTQTIIAKDGGWVLPQLNERCEILATRSMFFHGKLPSEKVATTAPVDVRSGAVEAIGFILRGVARQGEAPMALVEDLKSNQTRQLHIGDAFAGGKLVAITTDGIDRSLAGKVSHWKVGQTIQDGHAAPATSGPVLASQSEPPGDAPLAAGAKMLPVKDEGSPQ